MCQSVILLEKYRVKYSGYFILATTVSLGMGITYCKLLYFHGIAEENVDRNISTLQYNNSTVYDCFNNHCTDEFGSPALNIPPITFDYIPCPHKRARYTPYLLPAAISIASENSFSTLTTPSVSPDLLLSYDTNNLYVMKKYVPFLGRVKRLYYCSKHDQNICLKNKRLYCSTCSDKNNKFHCCHGISRINSETSTCFLEHQHSMSQFFS